MKKVEYADVLTLSADGFLSAPLIDTSVALCVYGIGDKFGEVKKKLGKLYGAVEVVADGKRVALEKAESAAVIEVEAQPEFDKNRYNAVDAARVIDRLMRIPGGCPWDSVQTHESIRVNMIEEAYEAVDAIDKKDLENMREEFGDVFLQALLQSAIARREGEFDFADVCDGLCKKLISRHTFIFGSDSAADAGDALTLWDRNKAKEKNYSSVKDQLKRLPEEFPALLRCQKAYKKIKKSGAAVDPKADLDAALAAHDYAAAIYALSALLSDGGLDAEVELNKLVKSKIDSL